MKTSEVLRRVREHLGDGIDPSMPSHKRYTCYATDYLYYQAQVIRDKDRTRIKKIVTAYLDGCGTLEGWLIECHHIFPMPTLAYRKKIMVTRKAWLTHLIEHYEAKGD